MTRNPATYSRWEFRVIATSTMTYPAGYEVTANCSDDVVRTWRVAEDTVIGTVEAVVPFDCAEAGPISIDTNQTMSITTTLAGLTSVTYDTADNDPNQIGRVRESDTQLRVRIRRLRGAVAGPTDPGLRRALLSLLWVEAISLARTGPAQPAITVVPEPIGATRKREFANAILATIAFGMVTSGTESQVVTLPDNSTDTIRWNLGTTIDVAIAVDVVLVGATLADITDSISDAIAGVFAALDVGSILRYAFVYRAIAEVSGVVGITTLTLDAGTSDIVPLSTQLIVIDGDPVIT